MRRAAPWLVSLGVAGLFLAPLLWMVLASCRTEEYIFSFTAADWVSVHGWTAGNYVEAWRRAALGHAFLISLAQVAVIAGAGLLLNAMAAFAFARCEFPGRDTLFAVLVALIILPVEVLAVPMFFTARDLGLTGPPLAAFGGLTLPFVVKAFNIYFLRQHFLAVPTALEEAAVLDGAGLWRQFWHVALPSVRPALATVAVLDLVTHWGDFLWPLLVSTRESTRTVQIGLANLFTEPPLHWGAILACSVLATAPVIAVFRLLQQFIVTTDATSCIK